MVENGRLGVLLKPETTKEERDTASQFFNDAYNLLSNNKEIAGVGTAVVVGAAIFAATRGKGSKVLSESIGAASTDASKVAALEPRGIAALRSTESQIGKPREFLAPNTVKLQEEKVIQPDVKRLYERAFPIEERQPTEEVAELIAEGKIRLHTTRSIADDKLLGYSFVSVHDKGTTLAHIADQRPPQFAHLDFLAVEDAVRSNGAGTLHMRRLLDELKTDRANFRALTLEMEDPLAAGLSAEEKAGRLFRSKFYERLGARNELPGKEVFDPATGHNVYQPGFKILDFDQITDAKKWTAAADNQPAEFRVFWLTDTDRPKPLSLARAFYQSESGYAIESTHPALKELMRLHR